MISIIVIVKNDRGIERTLASLCFSQTASKELEIIVVDASSGKLNDIKDKFFSIKWIDFKPIKNKKITIAHQRNQGVKSSKGDIIVFIDAGCIPEKLWLKTITQPIIDKEEKIVCGNTGSIGKKTLHDQTHEMRKNITYIDECATINLAIDADVFKNVGYFDEKFDYGSDVDFTWRAIDHGYKIRYLPNAYVEHDWGNFFADMNRSFKYGKARARLYKKHKNRRINLINKDIVALIYPLFIIFLPFTIIFPYYPLILIVPIMKNLNKNPLITTLDHLYYGVGVISELITKT